MAHIDHQYGPVAGPHQVLKLWLTYRYVAKCQANMSQLSPDFKPRS